MRKPHKPTEATFDLWHPETEIDSKVWVEWDYPDSEADYHGSITSCYIGEEEIDLEKYPAFEDTIQNEIDDLVKAHYEL
ncbi:MAG: hypothetical protein R3182_14310 [Draconibacterium sp.]|nr:hypothetical protein [Draconibacterium sp.]